MAPGELQRAGAQSENLALASELRQAVDAQLDPGERVHWTGRPIPARHAADAKGGYVFGGLWCGFLVVWTGLSVLGGSFLMAMFSIPFWLFGFYILSTPLRARQKAVRTIYAVTDRRALTLVLDGSVQVRSFFLDRMEGFEKDERPDGSGDLILRHDIIEDSEGKDRRAAGFFGIHDVREPEAILRKLRSRGSDVG